METPISRPREEQKAPDNGYLRRFLNSVFGVDRLVSSARKDFEKRLKEAITATEQRIKDSFNGYVPPDVHQEIVERLNAAREKIDTLQLERYWSKRQIEVAEETIKHPRKDACEDFCSINYFPESDVSLFLVCDGVSGKEGEKGSHLAANFLRDAIRDELKAKDRKPAEQIIEEQFKKAEQRMLEEVRAATTLELALFDHRTQKLYTAHCGDSEMYLIRGDATDYPFSNAKIEPFTKPYVDSNTGGPSRRLGPGGYGQFDANTFDINAMDDDHIFLLMTTDWIRERDIKGPTVEKGLRRYKRGDNLQSILAVITYFYEHPRELLLDKIKTWMAMDQFIYVMEELKKLDFNPDLRALNIRCSDDSPGSEAFYRRLYKQRVKIFSQLIYPENSVTDAWTRHLAILYDVAGGKIYDDFTAVVVDLKGTIKK